MIGSIRLVNPWRGTVWGSFSDRLNVTTSDGERWEIHCDDHYCGRSFSRHEIECWASGDPLSNEELSVGGVPSEDYLGEVPARDANPQDWAWCQMTAQGESRLKPDQRPSVDEMVTACKEAIEADLSESLPLVDRFELWGCELENAEPIALLLTGTTEFAARGTFSPSWRFCSAIDHEDYWPDQTEKPPTKVFEDKINGLLLKTESGRVTYAARLFERIDQKQAREIRLHESHPEPAAQPIELGQGLLAKQFLSEYLDLRDHWENAR